MKRLKNGKYIFAGIEVYDILDALISAHLYCNLKGYPYTGQRFFELATQMRKLEKEANEK